MELVTHLFSVFLWVNVYQAKVAKEISKFHFLNRLSQSIVSFFSSCAMSEHMLVVE